VRTALLFSGLTRGLSFTHENIKSNIIDNFGDCEIYFYLTGGSNWEEFQQSFKANSEAIKFLKGKVLFGADETPDPSIIENLNGVRTISDAGEPRQNGYYNQWLSVLKCKDFMVSNVNSLLLYDYVIRIRPDIIFKSPVSPDMVNLEGITVPDDQEFGGINDRFAIGSQNNMVKYCNFFKSDQFSDPNLCLDSEGRLQSYLNSLNIPIYKINAKNQVANSDGSFRY